MIKNLVSIKTLNTLRIMRQLFLLLVSLSCITGFTQTDTSSVEGTKLKVYLDCHDCSKSYFTRSLGTVDFVSDPKLSDVHIFVTKQKTASEGYQYGINFIGKEDYSDIKFKLNAVSNQDETKIQRWETLLRPVQSGLEPYICIQKSKQHNQLLNNEKNPYLSKKDPWNSWVFLFDLGGNLEAEDSQSEYNIEGEFNAKRITDKLKLRSTLDYEMGSEQYDNGGDEIKSTVEQYKWTARSVFSITKYVSLGLSGAAKHSTYYNIDKTFDFGPAIEYNIFPWDKSDRKVFTLTYQVKPRYYDYIDKTIYGKNNEWLWDESVKLELILRQPWGEIEGFIRGKHYLHNFNENSLEMNTKISVKIAKGFSIFLKLDASLLNNQRYIADIVQSRDELLLQQRQQATPFDLDGKFGIRYSFGSIYNNVVNQRM